MKEMTSSELDEIYKLVCRISGQKPLSRPNKEAVMKGLRVIEKQIKEKDELQEENERRVTQILEVIMAIAQLNYSKKAVISSKGDHIDALATGINTLGEELQSSTISLREKDVLLKEIHHRVKNNLQVISSLLNLQSENITDSHSLEKFKESQNRVRSMALVHEKLYESKDLSRIDFSEYIGAFAEMVNRSYNITDGRVKLHLNINIGNSYFNIDTAIPCALMLNELVSNAFKHAFPEKRKGNLYLNFKKDGKNFIFEVKDDGVGMSTDVSIRNSPSLGLQLVEMLTDQINGTVSYQSGKGTTFVIRFQQG